MIIGASGSGKSSFLKAGVLARLRKQPDAWIPLPAFRPEDSPLSAFAGALAKLLGAPDRNTVLSHVKAALDAGQETASIAAFRSSLQDTWKQHQATPVIAIDQAEELFDIDDSRKVESFVRLLSAAIRTGWIVVATLRNDFLTTLQKSSHLRSLVESGQLWPISPLQESEFSQVVEGPTDLCSVEFERGLSTALVRDAASSSAVPLMALALRELYDRRENGKRMTFNVYNSLGRLNGVVRTVAEQALPDLNAEDKQILHEAFVPALVRINDDDKFVRQRAAWSDLPTRAHAHLARLVEARLLVRSDGTDIDGDRQERPIEVAHEALFREWPLLASWLAQDLYSLQVVKGLRSAAKEWDRAGQRDSYITHRGDRLENAEEVARQTRFASMLNPAERDYIGRAVVLRMQRRQFERRARFRVWTLIGLVAFAVLAGGVGVAFQSIENLRNQSRLLADRARLANFQSDHALAKLLALEALPSARGGLRPTVSRAEAELKEALLFDRLNKVMRGHTSGVRAATFSPDGSRILTASEDTTARLWHVDGNSKTIVLNGHDGFIVSAAFSPDGTRVVTASTDTTARVWDARSGEKIRTLSGHKGIVSSATFSPDSKLIISSSHDKTARIWDAKSGEVINILSGHSDRVQNATFSPDGRYIVTASQDGTAKLWEVKSGKEAATLKGHETSVQYAAFSPNGQKVLTTSGDKTTRLWDVDSGEEILVMRGHENLIVKAAFSKDGDRVITASEDRTARIWNVRNGKALFVLRGHTEAVSDVAFDPQGHHVATASDDGTARLWNASSGRVVSVLRGHGAGVSSLGFGPAGDLIVTASFDNTTRIWNAQKSSNKMELRSKNRKGQNAALNSDASAAPSIFNDKIARVLSPTGGRYTYFVTRGDKYWMSDVDFSPDRRRIAIAFSDGTADVWDIERESLISEYSGHSGSLLSISFSPNGKMVVSSSSDKTVRIWNAYNGNEIEVLDGLNGWVRSAEFGPDSRFVVTTTDDGVVGIWDTEIGSNRILFGRDAGHPNNAAFSPDGSSLAIAYGEGLVRLVDVASGSLIASLSGHSGGIMSVSFSTDGRYVVTTSADRTARIWDAKSGRELAVLFGHERLVRSATFSPDGSRILTGSSDKTARIWDASSGEEIAVLRGHERRIMNASFSEDGSQIVTFSDDSIGRLWDAESISRGPDLVSEACGGLAIGRRALTPMEAKGASLNFDPVGPCDRFGPGHWRYYWNWIPRLLANWAA